MALITIGLAILIVGTPERCASRGRFDVDAAAATGTVINQQVREAYQETVPESV